MTVTLRVDGNGRIVQRLRAEEAAYYAKDPNVASEMVIDERANADLLAALMREPQRYRVVEGALQRDGAPVTVAPDSDESKFERGIDALLDSYKTTGAFTAAQRDKILAFLLRRWKRELF